MKEWSDGIIIDKGKIFTLNLTPGKKVYGERLVKDGGKEYRQWNPYKSKAGAAIKCGMTKFPVGKKCKILYLGASQGTTPSHFSDIAKNGIVYCVELGERNAVKLYDVCMERENMIPIIENANNPEKYGIEGKVDFIYQDISQKEQAKIVLKNSYLLNKGGYLMMAIKARSISQRQDKREIFKREVKELEKEFEILEKIDIHRYEKDHLFILGRKKK